MSPPRNRVWRKSSSPPDSNVIGKSARDLLLRQTYGQSLLAIHRGSDVFSHVETEEHESSRVGTIPLQGGDTIVVHTEWGNLTRLNKNPNFVIVTSDYPQEDLRPHKVGWALFFFAIALGLILFSDLRLSLCLLVGALGMILSNVLTVDEAYQSVGWNTVFLLASLIPLGAGGAKYRHGGMDSLSVFNSAGRLAFVVVASGFGGAGDYLYVGDV